MLILPLRFIGCKADELIKEALEDPARLLLEV